MEFPLLTTDLKPEFDLRIAKVQAAMQAHHVDTMLIASTVNIFYLTGGIFRGYVLLRSDRDPVIFMIPPAEPVGNLCVSIRKPEQISDWLASKRISPQEVALEMDDLLYSELMRLAKIFSPATLANASAVMRTARLTKTPYEIGRMREDGVRHCAVYSRIAKCYREDMTDLEFQAEIERVMRLEGNLGFLRAAGSRMEINMGSLLVGPNADAPSPYDFSMGGAGTDPSLPVGASGIIMRPGMSVMVDMNGGFNGYQTDMTRTWMVGEVLDEKNAEAATRAHQCSIDILRALEQYAVPGAEIGEMYRIAAGLAADAGLSHNFMGHTHKVKFIGHGVGIELNEAPVIMERNHALLEENMTLAIEPKFVLPAVGALGIENTYVVTPRGLDCLTPFPETLDTLMP